MAGARVPVTFAPAGLTVWVLAGTAVTDAARAAGVIVPAPCGGRGICGSCGVRVLKGELAPPDDEERRGLERAPAGVRLACRATIVEPVEVRPVIVHAQPLASGVGDAERSLMVAGIDLGTTTVAAVIVDPATGRELARAVAPNRQQAFGADILSRLGEAVQGRDAELAELAWVSVRDALDAARIASGAPSARIDRVVIAGNTAMTALLAGADVARLAVYPFETPAIPATLDAGPLTSARAPVTSISVVPAIAGFVGGDALAGVVAGGLCDATAPTLLVDVGTNAEIVLAGAGPLRAASAAAGPAFEGGGISCGGPAAPGAVERVRLGDDSLVEVSVIGGGEAQWLSGSGLISAVAELVRAGHVTADGLLVAAGPLASRFVVGSDGVLGVRLDAHGRVTLTQLDVRAVQLAKAAVRVGIERVVASAGIAIADVDEVCIAGAFGGALDARDLADLGIISAALEERVRSVGNTALEGAAMIALDEGMLACARDAAAGAIHVDLASDPEFADALMSATRLAPC